MPSKMSKYNSMLSTTYTRIFNVLIVVLALLSCVNSSKILDPEHNEGPIIDCEDCTPVPRPEYVDCTFTPCIFGVDTVPVSTANAIEYMTLPKNFIISFDYYFETIPEDATDQFGAMMLQNMLEIWNQNKTSSLLSVNRMWYGGFALVIYYDGKMLEFPEDRGYQFNYGWNTLKLKLEEQTLTLYGKTYHEGQPPEEIVLELPNQGTILSKYNILYTSGEIHEYRAHRMFTSAGGKIKNIFFSGALCCQSTSYYTLPWKDMCVNGGNNKLRADINTCSTCIAYQCLDWIAGSKGMRELAMEYSLESGDDVHFGVGAIGATNAEAGKCYRLTIPTAEKDLIVQAVTTSAKVNLTHGDFVLLTSGGGFDANGNNGCANYALDAEYALPQMTYYPQFNGPVEDFGEVKEEGWYNGGWDTRKKCDSLPAYPVCSVYPQDNQRGLCKWAFSQGLRQDGYLTGLNNSTKITAFCEVKCPAQMIIATGIKRTDNPSVETALTCPSIGDEVILAPGEMGELKTYMDCSIPAFSDQSSTLGLPMEEGFETVVPCRRDGYSRIDSVPTFAPTPSPTILNNTPTELPTSMPSGQPSGMPSMDPASTGSPQTMLAFPTYRPTDKPTRAPTSSDQLPGANSQSSASGSGDSWHPDSLMGFPFWAFIGICFTPIIGCACLSLCYFESAIRRKQEKERQQRETELHKKWADIAHQNDFEDNDDQSTAHYAPYVDSPEGSRSISRSNSSAYSAPIRSPTGISSAGAIRSPPHSSTKNQNQSFMSKLASGFSMSKPRGQSENMSALQGAIHNTPPPLQKMEVGEGSLDSKGSRKDTSSQMFGSPSNWLPDTQGYSLSASHDDYAAALGARATGSPMVGVHESDSEEE